MIFMIFSMLSISEVLSESKPNIILIMADDLGWADVSPYNPENNNTPNLIRLASSGVRYTDYHSAASVCTPSRSGLLTGRMGPRTGVLGNFEPSSIGGLPKTEHTLADYMKTANYHTGIIGKWHLGHTENFHPLSRGFDFYFGIPYSNDMGCVTCSPVYNIKQNTSCPGNEFNLGVPLYEDKTIIEQPVDLTTLSSRYTSKAKSFIEQAISQSVPFFLYTPLTHVHVPLATSKTYANKSSDGHFGDALIEMDHFVGEIIDFVKEHNISNNTIIIFTSDNGPWDLKCDLAGESKPFNGIWQLKEGGGGSSRKGTTWEGGHRVPFIVSWPGFLAPNTVSDELISALDIIPSLSIIANFTLPHDRVFDGQPFSFLSPRNIAEKRVLFFQSIMSEEIWALRYGKYKVYYATEPAPDCNDKTGKGFLYHNPALIFDTLKDPAESLPVEMDVSFYAEIEILMNEQHDSIQHTFRSKVDWRNDDSVRPCCNLNNDYCFCNAVI